MRKVFGLLAIMIALTMTIGAFAPSQIDLYNRGVSAQLASSDFDAVISLRNDPAAPFNFVTYDGMGRAQITVVAGGNGLNPASENYFDHILDVFNQGMEPYTVTITSSNPRIQFYQCWGGGSCSRMAHSTTYTFTVASGNTGVAGLYVDARGLSGGATITANLTISAVNP